MSGTLRWRSISTRLKAASGRSRNRCEHLPKPQFRLTGKYVKLTQEGNDIIAGTKLGGKRAVVTNKAKYGKDFYHKIGAIGGAKGHTGGFYNNRELVRIAGAMGGRTGKRGYRFIKETTEGLHYQNTKTGMIEVFKKVML